MAKKTGPYVGVTGFISRTEVDGALKYVPYGNARRLMMGVLMSDKTLAGNKNKYPGRFPTNGNVANIFPKDERALNLVHYHTDEPGKLYDQMIEIQNLAGPNFDGFQINMTWPWFDIFRRYKDHNADAFIVLQLGWEAMAHFQSKLEFCQKLALYQDCIDAVLIDPSSGTGREINAEDYVLYILAAQSFMPSMGMGISGGLGPRSLHLLDPFIKQFPNFKPGFQGFSIDAQSKLRTDKDDLDMEAVRMYLQDAFRKLDHNELPGTQFTSCDGRGAFRTNLAQTPHKLQAGERLANHYKVLSPSRDGGNGNVWIHIATRSGDSKGEWMLVPGHIPIAMAEESIGDIH